jgi:hypothetical protein
MEEWMRMMIQKATDEVTDAQAGGGLPENEVSEENGGALRENGGVLDENGGEVSDGVHSESLNPSRPKRTAKTIDRLKIRDSIESM